MPGYGAPSSYAAEKGSIADHPRIALAILAIVALAAVGVASHRAARAAAAWNVSANGTSSAVTPAQPAAAGDVIVAYAEGDGPDSAGSQSFTVSGCGLSWALLARENAQPGGAEAWAATASTASSCRVTVTAKVKRYPVSITAADYGAAGTPAAAAAHASSGAAQVTLTAPAGADVWMAGDDWDSAISRTLLPGDLLAHQWLSPTGDTYWAESATAPGGNMTIGTSAPAGDQWNAVAVVIPPAGPTPSPTDTSPSPSPTDTSPSPTPTSPSPTPTGTPPSGFASQATTGYQNAPGYPGSLSDCSGVAIQAGATYSFCDFPDGVQLGDSSSKVNNVTFIGCRFGSDASAYAAVAEYSTGTVFSYDTFEPSSVPLGSEPVSPYATPIAPIRAWRGRSSSRSPAGSPSTTPTCGASPTRSTSTSPPSPTR